MNRSLVILLHGVGSNGKDISGLASFWQQSLPNILFESPNAPEPFDHGIGFQWFSVSGVTERNRAQRITEARTAFDRLLTGIIEQHGLGRHLDRVVFAGFSQGSIMALDAIATGRWPVAGVLAYSGRLASPLPLTPADATRLMLIHGADDPVIQASETTQAAKTLKSLGLAVETHILPGLGHTISTEGAALGALFLRNTLQAEDGR
jgi:phospholipase/carboxylesterase